MQRMAHLTQDPQSGREMAPEIINDSDDEPGTILITSDESEADDSFSEDDNEPGTANGFIQLGGGKYRHMTFKEVECKRAFSNALLCKSFVPNEKFQNLHLTLLSIVINFTSSSGLY